MRRCLRWWPLLLTLPPALAGAADTLDEVVITARRYAEPLSAVPLSVSVVGGDALGSGTVDDLLSLSAHVPGLYFESMWGGSNSAPVMRGQSQASTAGDNVGVFVDGVYQGNRSAVDVETLDLERIEVVRGPQNALYGRSTFAGAINYVSRQPGARPALGVQLDAGNGGYRGLQGWRSFAAAGGWGARVAGSARDFDGTQPNAASRGAHLGGYSRRALSATIASPGDSALQATLRLRYQHASLAHPPTAAITYPQYNCGSRDPVSGAWSYFCGVVPAPAILDVSPDIPDSTGTVRQAALHVQFTRDAWRVEAESGGYSADAEAIRDLDDSSAGELFGVCTQGVNCAGLAGLPRFLTRTQRVNIVVRNGDSSREFTQEFRLGHDAGGPLRWLLGVVGFSSLSESRLSQGAQRGALTAAEQMTSLLPATPTQVGPSSTVNLILVADPSRSQVLQSLSRLRARSYAAFGTLDYTPSPQWRVHGELRATRERREFDSVLSGGAAGFGRAIPQQSFQDWNPRASIEWTPRNGSRLYLSAARGSRSGGINAVTGLVPEEQSYRAEHNWTTELGWRHARGSWNADATLYYIDWEDTQIIGFSNSPGISNLITRNTAGLVTSGIEGTIDWQWLPSLALHAAYSYAQPRFRAGSDDPGSTAFCGVSSTVTTSTFCVIGPSRSGGAAAGTLVPWIDGNVPNRTPRHTWQAGATWRLPIAADPGAWSAHLDASGQDRAYDRSINGAAFGARTLVDARLVRQHGAWSFELWARNLADVRYVRTLAPRGPNFYRIVPRPLDLILDDGRRFGLTLRYSR